MMRIAGTSWPSSWIWLSVLAGSVIRFWCGQHSQLWDCAPDQLAWQLGLDDAISNGNISYVRLIHYPHEGGSLLLSLLAILCQPLAGIMPPLSWAALLVDTLARFIQIRVALRVFGERTAMWFALWSVLSVPLMLPWGTVDFGLHALISFAPFLLLRHVSDAVASPMRIGLYCGIGICLAYDCVVLIPPYALWVFLRGDPLRSSLRPVARFLLGCAITVLPHVGLRVFCDNGFHLEELSPLSIRGLGWTTSAEGSLIGHVLSTWYAALPASFLLGAINGISPSTLSRIVLAFIAAGTIAAFVPRRDRSPIAMLLALVVLCFTILFGIGPFFTDRDDATSYVLYRHFSFIVPALVLLMIHGFVRIARYGRFVNIAWITCCAVASVLYVVNTTPCATPNYRAAGWVLARKFGHDPATLTHIADAAPPEFRNEVVIGYGWGTTATLLENRSAQDTATVARLGQLLGEFDEADAPLIAEGVGVAFAPGITPVLDKSLQKSLDARSEIK